MVLSVLWSYRTLAYQAEQVMNQYTEKKFPRRRPQLKRIDAVAEHSHPLYSVEPQNRCLTIPFILLCSIRGSLNYEAKNRHP